MTRQFLFHTIQSPLWAAALAAMVFAVLACIVLLYRYEQRLVSRKLGWSLLGLRTASVAIVFLCLLQPVIAWKSTSNRTGRIALAVDVSESMTTDDVQAPDAEKLRWARAVGLLGNSRIEQRLDEWIAALEAGQEPEWVGENETNDPQRAELLTAARKQFVEDVLSEVDRMSRQDIVSRLLSSSSLDFVESLQRQGSVELYTFAGEAQPLAKDQFVEAIDDRDEKLELHDSNLTEVLTAAAQSETSAAALAGVVLITDGRDTSSTEGALLRARAQALGVPIYPVVIGTVDRPRDLSVGELDYPETVFHEDTATLRARIYSSGFDGETIAVALESGDGETHEETFEISGAVTTVEFPLSADELGRRQYTLRIDPREGENRDDNNSKQFAVSVVDDRSRVLVIDGVARWEFRFLDNALSRDERVHVDTLVFRQPYMGVLNKTFFARSLQSAVDEIDAEAGTPFSQYDAVIVGDVAPHEITLDQWEQLRQFVEEEGGTLVLSAGRQYFPLTHRAAVLEELLPVDELELLQAGGAEAIAKPEDRGFALNLTADGERFEMLRLLAGRDENADLWQSLPGQPWLLRGTAKGGASVLVTAPAGTRADDLETERLTAVIVHQYLGSGQVLWIGTDGTWRWRHRVGDEYHHRFWAQMVRWAAEFKAAAGNEFVRFAVTPSVIEAGEDVTIRAQWNRNFLNRFPDLQARAEFYPVDQRRPGEAAITLALQPSDRSPLTYQAVATQPPPGDYRVRLIVEGADIGGEEIEALLSIARRPTNELMDVSANRALLEDLAELSGGRVFLPDRMAEIPKLFGDLTETETHQHDVTLWDHWLILAALCVTLSLEWVLRKVNGLP